MSEREVVLREALRDLMKAGVARFRYGHGAHDGWRRAYDRAAEALAAQDTTAEGDRRRWTITQIGINKDDGSPQLAVDGPALYPETPGTIDAWPKVKVEEVR